MNQRTEMKTADAIAQFGSTRKLADALGVSVQAIYKWGDDIPPLRVYQIREIQAGRTETGCHCEHKEAA